MLSPNHPAVEAAVPEEIHTILGFKNILFIAR